MGRCVPKLRRLQQLRPAQDPCPEAEIADPLWLESLTERVLEETSAPRTTSGMSKMRLWAGDGHRSPSPCTGLPESAWQAKMYTVSGSAMAEQTHLCPEVLGNSGIIKVGIGMTTATHRGPLLPCQTILKYGLLLAAQHPFHWSELLSRHKIGCAVQGSWD